MKSVATLASLLFLIVAPLSSAPGQSSARSLKEEAALERDRAAILDVIDRQSASFWAKDFDRWADTWVHAPYVRRVGWSTPGGVVSVEGWDAIGARMKKNMTDDPTPNLTPAKLVREHLNFRIQGDIAWVTFEQHGWRPATANLTCPDSVTRPASLKSTTASGGSPISATCSPERRGGKARSARWLPAP